MATDTAMQLGMVGLGRMGANLVRRLMRDRHHCVVYDMNADAVKSLAGEGATGAASLGEFVVKNVHYVDCGTSGGVWGLERGYCSQFAREDGVEETWRIVQPLLDAPPAVEPYAPGSWGPAAANKLVAGCTGWREPWLRC